MRDVPKPGETYKAHERRLATGWYDKYAPPHLPGIDIGPDRDPLNDTFRRWTWEGDGDATHMDGVPDDTYQTVYASHLLEHLQDVSTALNNWYRITRPGGHLIVCVPHRDLYEKRTTLPSKWNPEHKWYFMPYSHGEPCTLCLRDTIKQAIPAGELVSYDTLTDGLEFRSADRHSFGEYSIEAIVRKPLNEPLTGEGQERMGTVEAEGIDVLPVLD